MNQTKKKANFKYLIKNFHFVWEEQVNGLEYGKQGLEIYLKVFMQLVVHVSIIAYQNHPEEQTHKVSLPIVL